jgi:DNA-binding response OmpR family regulator
VPEKRYIILAEDNQNDVLLLRLAFRKAGKEETLLWCKDGTDVVSYLGFLEDELPRLIILDIKMLQMDAFETLRWIKSHVRFSRVPIVILTNSSMQADLDLTLSLGAADYIVKPYDFEHLCVRVKDIVARYMAES